MKILIKLILIFMVCLTYTCAPDQTVKRKGFEPKPCLDCHKKTLTEYQKKYIHKPMAEKDCDACHLRHGKIAVLSLKEREERKLCLNCHTRFAESVSKTPYIHSALRQGKCLPCHSPHASDNKYLQKKTGSEQCLICHKKDAFVRTKQHKPLADGCLVCHNAHGSQYEKNLVKQETELCKSCHSFETPGFKKAHRDYPVQKGKCTNCHTAHSSTNDKLLKESIHKPLRLGRVFFVP